LWYLLYSLERAKQLTMRTMSTPEVNNVFPDSDMPGIYIFVVGLTIRVPLVYAFERLKFRVARRASPLKYFLGSVRSITGRTHEIHRLCFPGFLFDGANDDNDPNDNPQYANKTMKGAVIMLEVIQGIVRIS
jgi:hypothetical protein